MDWNKSYSKYMRVLDPFFNDNYDPAYSRLKNRCALDLVYDILIFLDDLLASRAKEVLAMQDNLQEIVQLVGRESLSEDQKVCVVYPYTSGTNEYMLSLIPL